MCEPDVAAHNIGVCKTNLAQQSHQAQQLEVLSNQYQTYTSEKHISQWLTQTELTQKTLIISRHAQILGNSRRCTSWECVAACHRDAVILPSRTLSKNQ